MSYCKTTLRSAAICPKWDTILDHLGVLSILLKIPLIISDEKTYALAKKFYPMAELYLIGEEELSIPFMAEQFDLLFVSLITAAATLAPSFDLLSNKKMRVVYCPHGNSDKGETLTVHPPQDISFIYGPHMRDLLSRTGAMKAIRSTIETGNYRLPFFVENQTFYADLAEREVFSRFAQKQTTIFYAPTWGEESSFFTRTKNLIAELPDDINLLIKLHPLLFEKEPALTTALTQNRPNLVFLEEFPPIYPLLAGCDAYLGDHSSIGFDALALDKPLYLFPSTSSLHACALEVPSSPFSFIQKTLTHNQSTFRSARAEMCAHTFSASKNGEKLWDQLECVLQGRENGDLG
jgi:hypothetical protein